MYELNFKHKYGYILKIYQGPNAEKEMKADIQLYTDNYGSHGGEYWHYPEAGKMPIRYPLLTEKVAAG